MVRRVFALGLLLLVLAGVLCACGGSRPSYTIAIDPDLPPFAFPSNTAEGEYQGIEPDLLAAIAAIQEFDYTLEPMGRDAALEALAEGRVDGVLAGLSLTDALRGSATVSEPYYSGSIVLAVQAGETGIQSVEDLEGKTVAVRRGTAAAAYAESIAEKYRFNVVAFATAKEVYQDVGAGSDACIDEYCVLSYGIIQGSSLYVVTTLDRTAEYVLAASSEGDGTLLSAFQNGLAALREDGSYDSILGKYVVTNTTDSES